MNEEIRECGCGWSGPVSETLMLGSVGPLCPECRETTEIASRKPREFRISWSISGTNGNGLWFPESSAQMLRMNRDAMNAKYGPGTHWIEAREA